jgi:uncharacterized damage-inducible protein DinB
MDELGRELLRLLAARFESARTTAEQAVAQLDDEQLHWRPDPEANSVAVLLHHLAGSMRSRWRDFLTSDGEKADRDRDREFETPPGTRAELLRRWDEAWALQRAELARVTPADLLATVHTRSQPQPAVDAILRQLAHVNQHVGQIVYLAKHLRGPAWRTLTIARGRSREYNEKLGHHI